MRDGRKWRSVPFVIFTSPFDYEMVQYARSETHAHLLAAMHSYPPAMIRQIEVVVQEYQDKVLDDYGNFGILVRFENGRAQIQRALKKKDPTVESAYYAPSGDRRKSSGWVTFRRDREGLGRDVELFKGLLDMKASETEMHKFFEEHPAILMEARNGIPISHPNLNRPKGWKPDFAISPILGPMDDEIELLELKDGTLFWIPNFMATL